MHQFHAMTSNLSRLLLVLLVLSGLILARTSGTGGAVKEQSRALVHVAQASEAIGQVTQALQNLELALALAQQTQDRVWIATVLDNLGRTYLAARNTEAAMEHLTQALEMATPE